MDKNALAIGVFDSGMGGLTVLKALRATLPEESFYYLGDTARLPYGTKSAATVKQYAIQMANILIEKQIKALVIACNTATTAALSHLQDILPDLPVIGVVEPGAVAASKATNSQRIAVLATETTIASGAYQRIIRAHLPNAEIHSHACSLLVALAEEGMVDNEPARVILAHYLKNYKDEDTILLGCTHFPVFKKTLMGMLPDTVKIVDSAQATAEVLKETLSQKGLLKASGTNAKTLYLATDALERFQRVGEIFLEAPIAAESIELTDCLPGI